MEYVPSFVLCVILWNWVLNFFKIKEQRQGTLYSLKFILLFPVIVSATVLFVLLYPVFGVYRYMVSTALKVKHGKKFFGLLSGLDTIVALGNGRNNMIGILLIGELNNEKDILESAKEFVGENLLNNKHLSKLYTTLKSYGGYNYLENINVTIEDCVHSLPIVHGGITTNTLQHLLAQAQYLPFNGPILWDVLVGTQHIQNNSNANNSIKRYPIMIRAHHLIADGITLTQLLAGVFSDQSKIDVDSLKIEKTSCPVNQPNQSILNIIFFLPSTLYSIFSKTTNFNELHGKVLKNEEKIALKFDENGVYLQKVKNIRKQTSATIPEIILTAFSESLREHFVKYQKNCPKNVTFLIPFVQNKNELQNMQAIDIKDLELRNKFGAVLLQIPFIANGVNDSNNFPFYNKLKIIRKLTSELKTSSEFQVSYTMFHKIAPVFPICLLRFMPHLVHCTSLTSLLPVVRKKSACGGKAIVTDCIFWIPHIFGLDVNFGSVSYDNRLFLSMNCDATYMSQEVIEEVLDKTYKNIDLLQKEVECVHLV